MKPFHFLLTLLLLTQTVYGQEPVLLNDFTTRGASAFPSDPEFEALATDNLLFFLAETPDKGEELYRTNGTAIGTQLLKDIFPGSNDANIHFITSFGNKIYFAANDGVHGYELWTSQGTPTSTKMVADLREGSGNGVSSNVNSYAIFQDMLYFNGYSEQGYELLRLDPETDEISLVRDIYPGVNSNDQPNSSSPAKLAAAQDILYFEARDDQNGAELWATNGTAAGTILMKDIYEGLFWSQISNIKTFDNNIACFTADDGVHGRELWISLGSTASTYLIEDVTPGPEDSSIELLEVVGSKLYFKVRESFSSQKLWTTEGLPNTTAQVFVSDGEEFKTREHLFLNEQLFFRRGGRLWRTTGVRDSLVQIFNSYVDPSMAIYRDSLFFIANAGEGKGLWKTDGTQEGMSLVKEVTTETYHDIDHLYATEGNLYFIAESDSFGRELWTSDGTEEGTFMLVDSRPGPDDGFQSYEDVTFYSFANQLFYAGFDETNGRELWISDGSVEGTKLLKDINTQTEGIRLYSDPIGFGGNTFFTTEEGLWKTDGSAEGTQFMKETNLAFGLNVLGDKLLYTASAEGINRTIWMSDGTEEGTQMLLDSATAAPLSMVFQDHLPKMDNTLFFRGSDPENGNELWKTDGTPEGTVMVKDINPTGNSISLFEEDDYIIVNNELYFYADDGVLGQEMWKSDGTEEGTIQVTDINPTGGSIPRDFFEIDGNILFTADDGTGGRELWRTDGTPDGTALVKDIDPNAEEGGVRFSEFAKFKNLLFFSADNGVNGRELWKSDGTEEGTVLVKDIYPGGGGSNVRNFFATDSMLYFVAQDTVSRKIWKSDGSEAGTVSFLDLDGGFSFEGFTDANGTLFFAADDGQTGRELWRTDGTQEGTKLAADIFEGINGSFPRLLGYINDVLYFTAIDQAHGNEMWSLSPLETSVALQSDITEVCAPDDTVTFTASIADAGENPLVNWLVNGEVMESGSALEFKAGGLENNDEIQVQVISNASIWALEDSVLSTAITIQYTPLDPTITVSGEELTASEATAYQWYFNGEAIDKTTQTITAEESGEYQVEVFNEAGCAFLSQAVNIEVCNPETPIIQVDGSTLTVNITGSFTWFLDGNPLPDTTQSIEATQTGSYRVEVVDAQGCTATSEAVAYQVTGLVDERLVEGVQFYPNPAQSHLKIDSELNEPIAVAVYSVSGSLMYQSDLLPFATVHKVNVQDFANGLYFVILKSQKGIHRHKFIKQ